MRPKEESIINKDGTKTTIKATDHVRIDPKKGIYINGKLDPNAEGIISNK